MTTPMVVAYSGNRRMTRPPWSVNGPATPHNKVSGRRVPCASGCPAPVLGALRFQLTSVKLSSARAVVQGLNETLMSEQTTAPTSLAAHGSACLPSVEVDCYNAELKDEKGFLGDRASKGAFRDILEKWRKPLRKAGEDPFGDTP